MTLRATHRIMTGIPHGIGYVMDDNRVVWSCLKGPTPHKHPFLRGATRNSGARAQECAERHLRQMTEAP